LTSYNPLGKKIAGKKIRWEKKTAGKKIRWESKF